MIRLLSLADVFTILNLIFGFLAVVMAGNIRFAVSLVLLAVLSDGLDGVVARRNRNGMLGEYMDVGADLVSFCVAPTVILYRSILFSNGLTEIAVIACSTVFVVSGFIRLASFPIMKSRDFFVGLPTPAAGLIISLLVFIKTGVFYLMVVLVLLSFFMLINIRFPKPDVKVGSVAAVLILLVIVFGDYWCNLMPFLLLFSLIVYMIWGFLLFFKK